MGGGVFFEEMLKGFLNCTAAAAANKALQSRPTLCDPIDGSPPGSSIPGIFQARVLERGANFELIQSRILKN